MKRAAFEPHEDWPEEAHEKYFYHEDPKNARRKIKKEDLDTLEIWEESGDRA